MNRLLKKKKGFFNIHDFSLVSTWNDLIDEYEKIRRLVH